MNLLSCHYIAYLENAPIRLCLENQMRPQQQKPQWDVIDESREYQTHMHSKCQHYNTKITVYENTDCFTSSVKTMLGYTFTINKF